MVYAKYLTRKLKSDQRTGSNIQSMHISKLNFTYCVVNVFLRLTAHIPYYHCSHAISYKSQILQLATHSASF